MTLTLGTRSVSILRPMRRSLVLVALLALVLPLAGYAAARAGEGTLTVKDGRGKVSVQGKGVLLGRLDRGSIEVVDLSPDDAFDPIVFGDDAPVRLVGENGLRYAGRNMRFRVIGGKYGIVIRGSGIDLSVVANGTSTLEGESDQPGFYSLDGDDCRNGSADCKLLPEKQRTIKLGSGDRG